MCVCVHVVWGWMSRVAYAIPHATRHTHHQSFGRWIKNMHGDPPNVCSGCWCITAAPRFSWYSTRQSWSIINVRFDQVFDWWEEARAYRIDGLVRKGSRFYSPRIAIEMTLFIHLIQLANSVSKLIWRKEEKKTITVAMSMLRLDTRRVWNMHGRISVILPASEDPFGQF